MFNWFSKNKSNVPEGEQEQTRDALEKTRTGFLSRLGRLFTGKRKVDNAFLDELEEILLTSDVGVDTTVEIISRLEKRAAKDSFVSQEELLELLAEEIADILPNIQAPLATDFSLSGVSLPYVVLVVGVNGVGKTTTIGKLAHQYAAQGKKVILGAGDTFRAAAVDQLTIWKNRTGVEIVSHGINKPMW
jgi:fused signal recognition particle receptor